MANKKTPNPTKIATEPVTVGGWESDPYFKARLEVEAAGQSLKLDTASLLFSPGRVDHGPQLLLEQALVPAKTAGQILDLGCGYGTVGLALAAVQPQAQVWLSDKDLLAIHYARHNAELNGLANVQVCESIGVDEVPPQSFDLIVADIPAKIGDRAIEYDFLLKPLARLNEGGTYWFVTPAQLNRLIPGLARRHRLSVTEIIRQHGYILFRARRERPLDLASAGEEDLYFKKRIEWAFHRQKFEFNTGELLFSTLNVDSGTQFLLRHLQERLGQPTTVLDLGCGYGVIGITLARFLPTARVTLSDKDLLAVRYTRRNLARNNITNAEVVASIGLESLPEVGYDLIVSNIPGHIGDRAIEEDFLLKPLARLNPGSAYWFVIVEPLTPLIRRLCQQHELPLEQIARRPDHTVFAIVKP